MSSDASWSARMSAKAKARERQAHTTDPMYQKPGEEPNLAQWLWQQGAHVGPWIAGVVWAILDYEQQIDSEQGCGHSSEQIMAGECARNPDDSQALQWLADPLSNRPGFREEWQAPPLIG